MDRRVIEQKIESLSRCLARIAERCPLDAESLVTDYDAQDIVSVNLERAVQQCIDIASHIAADHDDVAAQSAGNLILDIAAKDIISSSTAEKIVRAIGFRNLLVHRYQTIDWKLVYTFVHERLFVFDDFTREILVWLR